MVFEKIGVAQVDKDLQALKIEIDKRLYVIGIQDLLEQAVKNHRIIGVFQIIEKPLQQETTTSEQVVTK
ncbi:MAG: hypothetical protein ABSF44_02460 [Candidatus Bathyarchaeia archaeon]